MRVMLRFFFLLLLCSSLNATEGLPDVLKAQMLLGQEVWTRVLHIVREHRDEDAPKDYYSLVFEFNRALWIYSPHEGTQNLSTMTGRTAQDKLLVTELLVRLVPGLRGVSVETDFAGAKPSRKTPRNGCFVESVAVWLSERRQGHVSKAASLFTFYWRSQSRLKGHTVLLLDREEVQLVIDQSRPEPARFTVPRKVAADAALLAKCLSPDVDVVETRILKMPVAG